MAVKIKQDEIQNLPDALTGESYVLMFGSIPGSSDNRRLTLQCKTCTIPAITNNTVEIQLAGFQKRQSGTNTNSGTFTCTFMETHDMAISSRLRTWLQYTRGTTTNSSIGYSEDYSRTATLTVFDTAGNESATYTIYKVSPQEIGEVALNSAGNAEAIEISCTFRYDYCIYGDSVTL